MKISVVIPAGFGSELEVLESLKNQAEKPVQIIVIRGDNPSKNRNRGVEKAKGEFVAFVNAHSSFPSNWIKNAIDFFKQYSEVDIVGGPQLTPASNSVFGKATGYALSSVFGAANVRGRYMPGKLNLNAGETDVTSSNLICKKEVFEKIKFNEAIYPGEDPLFISDAKKAGFKVAYSPDIVGFNRRRETQRELLKQMFKYGFMRTKKESFFNTLKMPLFLVPVFFVFYLAFLFFSIILSPAITRNVIGIEITGILSNFLVWISIPLMAYIFLDFVFSFYGSAKNSDFKAFFPMLLIYPSVHISYGTGIILGWIKNR